ncbi:MAG: hypothetical protein EA397_16960 [Deltaproteobacteria bacterium]|nr:MAG: hypothetical protein EA397_16960 [Deltaproteobacteria bacterium]
MDLLNDRYQIIAPLGEGGAGTTWRALDTQRNAEVTVKKLNIPLNATNEVMLERETRLLGQLTHPQIPRFVDAFVDEFRMRRYLHLVLDFVPGEPLSAAMADRRFSQDEVRDLVADLLGILAWLHRLAPPVIHRDVKPSNLILRPDGRIALIDFGLATDAVDRTFLHTMAVGTLGYQAPEQIAGDPCPASDVYGAGVVALELLTRASPRELLSGQTLRWQGRASRLSPEWRRWLERALSPDRDQRFADGAAALEALQDGPATSATQSRRAGEGRAAAGPGGAKKRSGPASARRASASSASVSATRAPPSSRPSPSAKRSASKGDAPKPQHASYVPGGSQAFEHFFPGRTSSTASAPSDGSSADAKWIAGVVALVALVSVGVGTFAVLSEEGGPAPTPPLAADPMSEAQVALQASSACRAGDHEACRSAARVLRAPRADGTVPNSSEQLARSLLATGCQGGHAPACVDLADIHGYTAQGGRWFARACALDDASACYALNLLPPGVVLTSHDTAPLEARCAPSPQATAPSEPCRTLATLHEMGRVEGGGPSMARLLLRRACEGGGCGQRDGE